MQTPLKVWRRRDIEVLLCHVMAGWQFVGGDDDNLLTLCFTGIQEDPEHIPIA